MNTLHVDFFIVGWPKTGSTSLHYYLSQHPEISMSLKKESYFFAKDIIQDADSINAGHFYKYRKEDDYKAIFENNIDDKLIGESSVFYIISDVALATIKEKFKDSKIIVLLRDPSDLAASWFHHLKQHSREDSHTIQDALAKQEERSKLKNLPPNTNTPIHLQYDHIVNFPLHLNKLYNLFDKENLCVIVYDDLKNNETNVVKKCFEFLGVSASFIPNFERKNVSKKTKNTKLKNMIDRNKKNVVGLLRFLGLLKENSFLHKIYLKAFTENKRRADGKKEEMDFLKNRYKDIVQQTSKTVDIDLIEKWDY